MRTPHAVLAARSASSPAFNTNNTGGLAVLAGGLTGLAVATVEGYFECAAIGPYVREHGVGPAAVGLAPGLSPSGAPALALLLRFN